VKKELDFVIAIIADPIGNRKRYTGIDELLPH
jgi:hypothetical protein